MTTRRNIDPFTFFERLAAEHKPRFHFRGRTKQQFQAWRQKVLPQVLATVGRKPQCVPANPELLARWNEDGLIKERWVIDTQPGLSAVVLIFRPEGLKRGEKRPTILAAHGHGTSGKHGPMGIPANDQERAYIRSTNYAYGLEMAKAGFVTYSLDWLGFGERDMGRKPHDLSKIGQRDICNVLYLCATMLGTTVMALNCHDGSRVTDFVCEQPYADPGALGVMGLSFGGTMTTWMALTDERFKAADIICYAGPFYDIAYRTYNVCGSQVTPALFALVDTPELQGLIAPRPLLVEIGVHDTCFHVDHTLNRHYRKLEQIYKAAGAAIDLDLFPGPHAWGGNKSVGFFKEHLREF